MKRKRRTTTVKVTGSHTRMEASPISLPATVFSDIGYKSNRTRDGSLIIHADFKPGARLSDLIKAIRDFGDECTMFPADAKKRKR